MESVDRKEVDTLAKLSCSTGQVASFDGQSWSCTTIEGVSLPTCNNGQILARTGGSWACADTPATAVLPASCTDGQILGRDQNAWICVTLPRELDALSCADGQVIERSLGSWTCGDVPLRGLSCADGQVAQFAGGAWGCVDDADTLRDISCSVGLFPQLTASGWSCVTPSDTLTRLTCAAGQTAVWNGNAWSCAFPSLSVDRTEDAEDGSGVEQRDLQAIVDDLRTRIRRLEGPAGYERIPPGVFTLGSPASEPGRFADEISPRTIRISRAFWLKRTELTQRELCELRGCDPTVGNTTQNPSQHINCPDCPAEHLNWNQAIEVVNAMSDRDGLQRCYQGASSAWTFRGLDCEGYRLPTEAEWEYAARAGTSTLAFGSAPIRVSVDDCSVSDPGLHAIGWYCANSAVPIDCNPLSLSSRGGPACANTHPVGTKAANGFGLYDMFGNVSEWTNDHWGDVNRANPSLDFDTCTDPCVDPSRPATGVSTRYIVTKGGNWHGFARDSRAAFRSSPSPNLAQRGVRALPAQAEGYWGVRPARTIAR